jgi:dolichyl-phosphate-mannose-protein mannosyltransferase
VTGRAWGQVGLVVALALGLRLYDLQNPRSRWLDEVPNVDAAVHYWEAGQFEPDTWEHPPLRNLTAFAFLAVFGDNPQGWRLRNVLAGTLAAALTWLLAFQRGGGRPALLAGLLVATDPLHVVLSRFTFEEILGGTFFLGAVVVFAGRERRSGRLLVAAFLMGCALATKWYFLPGWVLGGLLLARDPESRRDVSTAAFVAAAWILVPLGVFLATYLPWFARGYRLGELPEFLANAYAHLRAMTAFSVTVIDQREVFHHHMSAAEWFVRPIWLGEGRFAGGSHGQFIMYVGSFPAWGLVIPALAATLVQAARRREGALALPAAFFLATYAISLFASRPMMLYSAAPLLPFAFVAVALWITWLAQRVGPWLYGVALAGLVGWNLFLYPLVTAKWVPLAAYRWLLDRADLVLH